MKKHLLALLSVGSLVTLLPGCGSCCQQNKEVMTETTTVEETANTEVAAVDSVVTEAEVPAQDAATEAVPVAEDKH